jgi:hypothetical protein
MFLCFNIVRRRKLTSNVNVADKMIAIDSFKSLVSVWTEIRNPSKSEFFVVIVFHWQIPIRHTRYIAALFA